ncbi:MAG: hypothetical protein IJ594_06710 [Oscillospiraceae bacterium]|nr:hypothetical protein [Oscillospiraceae bacterium]
MFEIERYRKSFDEIHAPEAMRSEVLNMTESKAVHTRIPRRVLTLAAVAALLLALSVGAWAAGRSVYGWGGNFEVVSEQTADGVVYTESVLHTDALTEPVEIVDGRTYFIVNGEHTDITDAISETEPYLYEYTDEEGVVHHWLVGKNGPEPEHYGYAEFLFRPGEDWLGGYAARTNNNEAPWLDKGKALLHVPW